MTLAQQAILYCSLYAGTMILVGYLVWEHESRKRKKKRFWERDLW